MVQRHKFVIITLSLVYLRCNSLYFLVDSGMTNKGGNYVYKKNKILFVS